MPKYAGMMCSFEASKTLIDGYKKALGSPMNGFDTHSSFHRQQQHFTIALSRQAFQTWLPWSPKPMSDTPPVRYSWYRGISE
jgi:hypothetical protein